MCRKNPLDGFLKNWVQAINRIGFAFGAIAVDRRTSLCTDALAMAIKNRKHLDQKLIHHSDIGFQYCTGFAESNGITMSMTELYAPYENAVAERINRTLKYGSSTKNDPGIRIYL